MSAEWADLVEAFSLLGVDAGDTVRSITVDFDATSAHVTVTRLDGGRVWSTAHSVPRRPEPEPVCDCLS